MRSVLRVFCLSCFGLWAISACKPAASSKIDEWLSAVREKVTKSGEDRSKGDASKPGSTAGKGTLQEKSFFSIQYEASQARAVREFPELGVAGSAFNSEFLARVKVLKTEDVRYFNNPNWPYDLAVRVNEILRSHPSDKDAISAVVIAEKSSRYVGQWVTAVGTLVKVSGGSISSPVVLELEGGVRVEVAPEQFVRKRGGGISEWSERTYKVESKDDGVVFFVKKSTAWTELFTLLPGSTITVKAQVSQSENVLVMKMAKLMDWNDRH
jgi:hypothetical protein